MLCAEDGYLMHCVAYLCYIGVSAVLSELLNNLL